MAVRAASFTAGLPVLCTGYLMTLVLVVEIVRVTVFVFGLVIFFAKTTTLALDTSISSKVAHFVSASTASI